MADTISSQERSRLMSRVKSKGNLTTEVAMVRIMRAGGVVGWRRHVKVFSFRPDFVFRKERVALFVDGCFWHSCPIHGTTPLSNEDFWSAKLEANVLRDRRADRVLADSGWKAVRFWEHEVRHMPLLCLDLLLYALDRKNPTSRCVGAVS